LRTTQKQLDQAQAALHVSDQQSEELTASARALRLQVDELRKRLAESEQVSSERHMALAQVSSDLNETQARFNETQRVAAERQATLVSVNAQLSEYRARIAEADISTAEMQATLLSLGSQIEAHRMRLAEIERRAQAPREALVPSAAKSMAAAKEAISIPKPRSIPTPPPTTPAVTPVEPPKASETIRSAVMPAPASNGCEPNEGGEDDQIVELQDQVATLMERLQTLRENGTPAPAPLQKATDTEQSLLVAEPPEPLNDDASAAPDGVLTLENIKGIGVGYAARLRASGITNVRDLANSTRAQLETIIKAPKWRQPDYEDWIRTARLMVRSGAQ
jgi:predicted flap endonuclease-1-like 5' DNA nuclease